MSALQWRHDGGRIARRGGDCLPAVWLSRVSRNADEEAGAGRSHRKEGSMNSTTHIHLKRRPRAGGAKPPPFEVTRCPESNKSVGSDLCLHAFIRLHTPLT